MKIIENCGVFAEMYKNKFKQKEIHVEIVRGQSRSGYTRERSEFLNRLRLWNTRPISK